ncbi:hypothetical protein F4825DRAFT_251631 [Nemania diffusa]|nr:hypothetical protein F4825DRAFT_251631 [Nemania diffusa]
MPLKRGLERESCDFCFRRKIKCDRSSRALSGHPTCSQCDIRQTPCTFDSDDVRVQRRRMSSLKAGITSHGSIRNDLNDTPSSFSDRATISAQLPLDRGVSTITQSLMSRPSLPSYPDFEFELSPEGTSFLDSIFLQNHDMTEPMTNWDNMPTLALQLIDGSQNNLVAAKNPYCYLDIQPEILDAAIDAYFNVASIALPILSKEGFIADYKDHLSSPALVFAVACRGCPFTQAPEKWTLQQRLATRFRETFLQARSTASSQAVVRLDELEALALMVDFEYQNSEDSTSPLQLQLQNLLLTHDSLVGMTLQYRIETQLAAETGVPTTLSRATQRQTLLFWYVYGWDAFFSLDRKVPSRIRDEDIDLSRQSYEYESQSYFDAILSLAGIARKMTRTLCSPIARRKGTKHQDIENIYKQLEDWHMNICPPSLQVQSSSHDSSRQERTLSFSTEIKQFPHIHRVIATLLELNCFMQVEACVSQYGIEEPGSLMGQIIDMRVKYETLQAAQKIAEVAGWIEKLTVSQRTSTSISTHVMADLAPGVIRNICAGASTWLSGRAKEILHPTAHDEISNHTVSTPGFSAGNTDIAGLSKEPAGSWMESLATLRNIAATATSHQDTGYLVERLDRQLKPLKELAKTYEGK